MRPPDVGARTVWDDFPDGQDNCPGTGEEGRGIVDFVLLEP